MQIKCTSCGATQELAANQQCGYCGSAIEQEKAQENYKTATTGEIGNLMMMAETAIDATNWEEALQYYNKTLEKDITNSDAWLGKGIAIVYTSKIGDIKTTEAIAYWKNAIKHSENTEAMGKRVAKEINQVVNSFYPAIENHYTEFNELDNAYNELASKFIKLEIAQDFALTNDPKNIEIATSGYLLCEKVIEIPNRFANSQKNGALAEAVFAGLSQNKYRGQDANEKYYSAQERQKEIQFFQSKIFNIKLKYLNSIKTIDPKNKLLENSNNIQKNNQINNDYIKIEWFEKTNTLILAWIIFWPLGLVGTILNYRKKKNKKN
jgi:hypothetical protein